MMNSRLEPSKRSEPGNGGWNLDEFLAVVLHEIRNSTQSITGWAELMSMKPASDEVLSRGLEVIRRSGQLQTMLIRQLLAFLRKQGGDLWPEASRVALLPVLESAIIAVTPQALAKAINLDTELEPSAASIIGDAHQLEEVFTNLLSNAIKFTPAGGRIRVRFRCRKGCARITVSDAGRGISAEFLPHVFDRFQQEKGNPAGHDGLGLGLAIARYLVEKHDGKIHAFSPGEGKGATFEVCFTLDTDPEARRLLPETWITAVSHQN
ncbi:MAG TPA: HAMP domain-containing sensor histidine kinase [Blastocatellia bacterium]|nr:HAMP domain-containing sensor histidine kinase [Blastocatellia bacterium]